MAIKSGFTPIVLPWTSKPPAGTPIDWSNSLTNGLIAAWAFNENGGYPLNLCRPVASTFTGTRSWQQNGLYLNTTSYFQQTSVGVADLSLSGITCLIRATFDSITTWDGDGGIFGRFVTGSTTGFTQFQISRSGTTSTLHVNHNGTSYTLTNLSNLWDDGSAHNIIVSDAGTGLRIRSYLDGLLKDNFTFGTAMPTGTDGNFYVNMQSSATPLSASGNYELILVYNRVLSMQEAGTLGLNPWQVFQPNIIYVPATLVPVTTITDYIFTEVDTTLLTFAIDAHRKYVHTPSGGFVASGTSRPVIEYIAPEVITTVVLRFAALRPKQYSSTTSGGAVVSSNTSATKEQIGYVASEKDFILLAFAVDAHRKVTSTTSGGTAIGGGSGTTLVNYNFVPSGGLRVGGNYTYTHIPVGGTVVSGSFGIYMFGGVVLGGNAAKSYNTVFTPSGGIVLGNDTPISLTDALSNSGVVVSGLAIDTYYHFPSGGLVTSNDYTQIDVAIDITVDSNGLLVGGTSFNLIFTPDGGTVIGGSALEDIGYDDGIYSTTGIVTSNDATLTEVDIDLSVSTKGIVVGGSGVEIEELVVGGFLFGNDPTIITVTIDNSVGTTGIVAGGFYTDNEFSYPDGGFVVAGDSSAISLVETPDGGLVIEGFYTQTLEYVPDGGFLVGGNYLYQFFPDGGLVTSNDITTIAVSIIPLSGFVIGNQFTPISIAVASSGGWRVGGTALSGGNINEPPDGGVVIGGIALEGLKALVTGGSVVGGVTPTLITSSVSGGIVESLDTYFVVGAIYEPTGGVVVGGSSLQTYGFVGSGGLVTSNDPIQIKIIETPTGGLVVSSTTDIQVAITETSISGGIVISGHYAVIATHVPDGGLVVDSATLVDLLLYADGGTVLGYEETETVLTVSMIGGIVVSEEVQLESIVLPANGGLVISNSPILEGEEYFEVGEGGVVVGTTNITTISSTTSGGVVVSGKYSIGTKVEGGLVVSNDKLVTLVEVTTSSGSVYGGAYTDTEVTLTDGGTVISGDTAVNVVVPTKGGVVIANITPIDLTFDSTLGVVVGGDSLQVIGSKVEGGLVVSNDILVIPITVPMIGGWVSSTNTPMVIHAIDLVSGGLVIGGHYFQTSKKVKIEMVIRSSKLKFKIRKGGI